MLLHFFWLFGTKKTENNGKITKKIIKICTKNEQFAPHNFLVSYELHNWTSTECNINCCKNEPVNRYIKNIWPKPKQQNDLCENRLLWLNFWFSFLAFEKEMRVYFSCARSLRRLWDRMNNFVRRSCSSEHSAYSP